MGLLLGNPLKLGLANVSLAFDIVFIVQHFFLYGPVEVDDSLDNSSKDRLDDREGERQPLISERA
jgi:cystinosin